MGHYHRTAKWRANNPWVVHLQNARQRCTLKSHESFPWYGGKGIRCLLTVLEIKSLWLRDSADSLKRPSLDRIDSRRDYVLSNCRFIELHANVSAPAVRGKKDHACAEE